MLLQTSKNVICKGCQVGPISLSKNAGPVSLHGAMIPKLINTIYTKKLRDGLRDESSFKFQNFNG